MSYLLKFLIAFWLLFALSGCLSGEMATSIDGATQAVVKAAISLEKAGVDHAFRMRIPTEMAVSWTPFGAKLEIVNGVIDLDIGSGRGLADRPPGAESPAAILESRGGVTGGG